MTEILIGEAIIDFVSMVKRKNIFNLIFRRTEKWK